jgi:hypothetical protein
MLLVIIPEDRLLAMEKYLNEERPTLITTISGTRFFQQEINPK